MPEAARPAARLPSFCLKVAMSCLLLVRSLRLSILLLLLGAGLLAQQPAAAQSVRFGVEAGVSSISHHYSNLPANWTLDQKFLPSYSVMAFADIDTRSDLDFRVGLRYVPLGSVYEYNVLVTEEPIPEEIRRVGEIEITQDYLFFVLRGRYQIGGLPVYLVAGPEMGFLLDATRDRDEQLPRPQRTNNNIDPQINGVNVTLGGGLGVQQRIQGFPIHLQVLFVQGIQDVPLEQYWSESWRTREIAMTVGVAF